MLEKQKVLRLKKGDVFRLKISEEIYAYAQYAKPPLAIFFNAFSKGYLSIEDVINMPTAFKVYVHKSTFKNDLCERIGNTEVSEANMMEPLTFKQDIISGGLFLYKYQGDASNVFHPAKYEDCENIETTSVWEFFHVRTRLLDLFEGKPNRWIGKYVIDQEKLAKYLEKQK